ncbi:MmcQ/YjbR family DNA-binding protein [Sphingomonas sp. GB1N7]|uniref:MmcQ/YjbR family DNA-binding protein n=1 Tax=Parasphingomonas caseinilytica TaxID=3096158 RepID=UPI002FC9F30A
MTRFERWSDVTAFALALPDTSMDPFYGTSCPKVNKKAFVSTGREPDSFHVMCPQDEKTILLETDPDTFWQTPHYEGWSGLLVRYGSADPDRIRIVITRAWWDKASAAQRRAFGDRP